MKSFHCSVWRLIYQRQSYTNTQLYSFSDDLQGPRQRSTVVGKEKDMVGGGFVRFIGLLGCCRHKVDGIYNMKPKKNDVKTSDFLELEIAYS